MGNAYPETDVPSSTERSLGSRLRLCVYCPMLLYDDGQQLTTDGTFQLMLPEFARHFASLDLAAGVLHTASLRGRERVPREGIGIVALPPFRSGKEYYTLKLPAYLMAAVRCFLCIGGRWDLVWIVDCEPSNQLLFWLCRLFRRPYVLYMRGREDKGYNLRRRPALWRLLASLYMAYQRRMLPLMAARSWLMVTGKELQELFGTGAERCHLYTSSVIRRRDVETNLPAERRQRRDGCLHLVYVGRVAPVKGLGVLVDALHRLKQEAPHVDIRLRIVGHNVVTDEEARLRDAIAKHGLTACVEFVPPMAMGPALLEEYRQADVFVCPSLQEGTPKTIPEAMCKALPVIASNVGGIPTMVRDGVEGLLVEPDDPQALADAILTLAINCELRFQMGVRAAQRAQTFVLEEQAAAAAAYMTEAWLACAGRAHAKG